MLFFVFENEPQVAVSPFFVQSYIFWHFVDLLPVIANIAVYLDGLSVGLSHSKSIILFTFTFNEFQWVFALRIASKSFDVEIAHDTPNWLGKLNLDESNDQEQETLTEEKVSK